MPVDNLAVCISKGVLRGIGENGVERAERANLVGVRSGCVCWKWPIDLIGDLLKWLIEPLSWWYLVGCWGRH